MISHDDLFGCVFFCELFRAAYLHVVVVGYNGSKNAVVVLSTAQVHARKVDIGTQATR
jgi:hypothetical protein